ncbi:hypothetical protein AKJ48_03815 [candidate division MSBL1 archaeon SCGC-AAA261O19]|uniref:ATP--dephospho-CoA triphosphoribosyl transferase CitG n=1 Tax=candidate division MSBL1 archaeon SCGC-AAA261O19 TaxID=1698277 RepID=A0A133VAS9_9EURY|nr:hypothetical protein AKJ48_03815 [candidate division MSBL1 archaeon SCGC-AAA261O19]
MILLQLKPGNVHRYSNLKEETFGQFITGAIVIGPSLRKAVEKGFNAGEEKLEVSNIQVGDMIKEGVSATRTWARENTNLGTLLLLTPLAAAGGMTIAKETRHTAGKLRENLSNVLRSTDSVDALNVYDAILISGARGLGDVARLSVKDEASKEEIAREDITLYEIMEISSDWDMIAKEWVTDMQVTFEEGFPLLKKFYGEKKDLNAAIVQTFLKILSTHPDSFIRRRHGERIAKKTSERAKTVIEEGGAFTPDGRSVINKLDKQLKEKNINPGTTADLIASSLMVALFDGLKPKL